MKRIFAFEEREVMGISQKIPLDWEQDVILREHIVKHISYRNVFKYQLSYYGLA